MISTVEWARSHNESTESIPPVIEGSTHAYPRRARQIALRAIILQGVVAVGYGVDPEPIIEWFHQQRIWWAVSPSEKQFLLADSRSDKECSDMRWREEAQWALLWMIGKVEALGLPDHRCNTRTIVKFIPSLGSKIRYFLETANLRHPSVLLTEDLRTYDLWCYAVKDRRENRLPHDLDISVLYQREYAFEWLDSRQAWDSIVCDA